VYHLVVNLVTNCRATCLILPLLCLACASSGTAVSDRTSVYGSHELIWLAAQSAVQDMGGRIVHASNQAGSIAAHLDAEGNTVRLDVTLSKGPGTEGNDDYPVDVSAHASLVGIDDLDPGMREQLERIVEEYLRFLEQRARPRR
jgi:hypothetical protein